MKVKICGLTNLEDAQTAVAAGADYLGFIFYPPSKRSVDIKNAKEIVQTVRSAPNCPVLVGVFVNETGERMAAILDEVGLDLAQLSGEEVPFLVGDERSPIYGRCYKALRPASLAEAEADAEWYSVNGDQLSVNGEQSPVSNLQSPSLLIDTYHPTLRGGTGEAGDWAMSAQLAQNISGLMLAGGLTAENVAEAVRLVRPFAVDVASGVEARPGQKDPNLVRTFIHNAKTAISSE
ncbi:MAG: phosphoribosylanthranilate isomerase [Ardenticatenaceae bacterium]|nr:phosphoribosylanthranilate isomerase [Anaerolineales bacterium]MCB8940703.1 phosphoribosylanthranilate isomerase [Ardenticatenaceae bacterium]MCB8972042.1 phosphoribosylanthranilate isomerase [Ardenticatenaceae bacterium]